MLCNHPAIAGVQAEEHQGIHESAFFSHVEGFFGDLNDANNFIQFVEVFGSSDYFRLTGLCKSLLYEHQPRTYEAAFRVVMDQYAKTQGKRFWVEKTPSHTRHAERIASYYDDAKFIIVERDVRSVVNSFIKHNDVQGGLRKRIFILRNVFHYVKYEKYAASFIAHNHRCYRVRYEDLVNNPASSMEDICHFLGIHYDGRVTEQRFNPNSSFGALNKRESLLDDFDTLFISLLGGAMRLLPLFAYRVIQAFLDFARPKTLPSWFWKIAKQECNLQSAERQKS